MSNKADKALLPAGMSDVLAPDAAFEASVLDRLLADFSGHGYDRVAPPLIEFEKSLLTGIGAGQAGQTFRLMDPISQKMMGVRADMTPQIARIASTRMINAPRPLRLSYAGQVLRVRGSQLRPERQFTQAGAELIGADGAAADTEVIVMAANALRNIGVKDLSCDLGLPTLVPDFCRGGPAGEGGNADLQARLRQALDRKDAAAVAGLSDELGEYTAGPLAAMLAAAGPAVDTLKVLGGLGLKSDALAGLELLNDVVDRVRSALPDLTMTIDPVENRGFEYHTGVTFTFFAKGVRGELGNGGRYLANGGFGSDREAATGFTLFMDTVLRAVPAPVPASRVFLPAKTAVQAAADLRSEGWITVAGLEDGSDSETEAARLGCSHRLDAGKVRAIKKENKE
ncbi:MAG: ATP phosphoribosyltransferase regulatory subunit [Proteobacteria bacterium]|nr:ATP phosphoribosyltransferase regulatory subunit [Pseudomonadota bacterium]